MVLRTLAPGGSPTPPGVLLQARRSAALMLDSEALIGRLHRYVVGGEDAGALCFKVPGSTDRSCKPVRVLDSLVEGVKAGVAMPYDRMLEDFWLAGKSECAAEVGRGRGAVRGAACGEHKGEGNKRQRGQR